MKGYMPLSELVGDAEPLNPAVMQFRAKPALLWLPRNDPNPERGCAGCCFKGQKAKVCVQAGQIARLARINDCEDRDAETGKTFVYYEIPIDERQLTID